MKSNNKVYIVLLIILFVFFLVMFSLFGIENIKKEQYSATIIVGDTSVWKYQNEKWLNIRTKSSLEELSWKPYTIYSNKEEKGKYELWYNENHWYAFDEYRTAIPIEGTLFAYDSNYDLKITYPTEQQVTDYTYVYQILSQNNLDTDSRFSSIYKMSFDFDNDSIEEEFYSITNAFALDFYPEKVFSIAFMVKNNQIYEIYKDIRGNNYYDGCKPFYNTFLDINNDNIYEFILSCGKYSELEQIDMLYGWDGNGFKIIISNQ